MEAIVGVWLTSLVGAVGFSAAGYILGQRGVSVPFLGLAPPADAPPTRPSPVLAKLDTGGALESTETKKHAVLRDLAESELRRAREEERETPVPDFSTRPTTPPPPNVTMDVAAPPRASGASQRGIASETLDALRLARAELEVTKSELEEAQTRMKSANEVARSANVVRGDLERQLEGLRADVKREVVARSVAEKKVEELGDRLAAASEEAASLRHRSSTLGKQSRQLREVLQSQDARREQLAEPDPSLTLEIARLTAENRSLRGRALGSLPPKPESIRPSASDIDLGAYRAAIGKIMGIGGIRGAVVGDDQGSVLVGSGELADGLAAFGAYIRDASGRSDRLLPLEGVDQVEIRDRSGVFLSARVFPPELLLVVLGSADAMAAARRSADELLGALRSRDLR